MKYSLFKKDNLKTGEWAGGTTTELFIHPAGSNVARRDFDLRVSTATVELDESEFSDYSGYRRRIMPIEGEMRLAHDEADRVSLAVFESTTFDGGRRTRSFGRCRDFNLIHRPEWSGGIGGALQGEGFECPAPGFAGLYALADTEFTVARDDSSETLTLESGDFFLLECDARDKVKITLTSTGDSANTTKYIAAAFVARR